jgi:Protein of unknown function (DUF3567)
MNMVYNSPHYCVVQFLDFGDETKHPAGGFEIMDKGMRREIFINGSQAELFKSNVAQLMSNEATNDEFDDYLATFAGMMTQTVALH